MKKPINKINIILPIAAFLVLCFLVVVLIINLTTKPTIYFPEELTGEIEEYVAIIENTAEPSGICFSLQATYTRATDEDFQKDYEECKKLLENLKSAERPQDENLKDLYSKVDTFLDAAEQNLQKYLDYRASNTSISTPRPAISESTDDNGEQPSNNNQFYDAFLNLHDSIDKIKPSLDKNQNL